jgi:hypothetical protein
MPADRICPDQGPLEWCRICGGAALKAKRHSRHRVQLTVDDVVETASGADGNRDLAIVTTSDASIRRSY